MQSSLDGIVGMSLGRAEANAAGLAGEEVAAMGTALSDNVEMELYPALKLTDPTLTFLVLLSVSVSYTSVMLSNRLESSSKTLLRERSL